MKRTNEQQTENALKRFLKKKVAFTASLLVSFLITGGIGLASSAELESKVAATHDTLISSIEAQKAEVQALLDENEARLRQLKLDTDELIRKGEWYSKPVYKQGFPGQPFPAAQQVWFSYWFENAGKSKNKTRSEWKNTIDAIAYRKAGYETEKGINPYAKGEVENGILDSEKNIPEGDKLYDVEINGNIPNGLSASEAAMAAGVDPYGVLQDGNGVYINNPPWVEQLDLGANIKPLSPELPEISKTVNVNVNSPVVTGPTIGAIPSVTPPAAPADVNVTVTPPAAVAAINVTPPAAPTPVTPGAVTVAPPTVATPSAIDPTMVVAPETPDAPVIALPDIPSFELVSSSGGNNQETYVENAGGSNAVIAHVAVQKGTFDVWRTGNSSWTYKFSDYDAKNISTIAATGSYTTAAGASETGLTTGGATKNTTGNALGFEKVVWGTGTYNNGNFLYTREEENSSTRLGELVHLDIHDYGWTAKESDVRAALVSGLIGAAASKSTDVLAAWDDVADNIYAAFDSSGTDYAKAKTWVNSGDIIIEGGNASVTNQYDHSSGAKSSVINTGKITIQPYYDGTDYFQRYNAVFLSSEHNRGGYHVMYNGSTGIINVWTPSSTGYTISVNDSSYTNAKYITTANRGTFNILGEKSVGVYVKQIKPDNSILDLNFIDGINEKPITIYGDQSTGLYINSITNGSVQGTFYVNIGKPGVSGASGLVLAAPAVGNQKFTTTSTHGTTLTNYDVNTTSTSDDIEGSVGIISKVDIDLSKHGINIYDKTQKNVGVVPQATFVTATNIKPSTLSLGTGSIKLYGGTSNVGIYADDIMPTSATDPNNAAGDVKSTGTVELLDGTGNIGIFASGTKLTANTYKVQVSSLSAIKDTDPDKITLQPKNNIGVYADTGATVKIDNGIVFTEQVVDNPVKTTPGTVVLAANTNNSIAVYATGKIGPNSTKVIINKASLSATPDIEITGAQVKGTDGDLIDNTYRGNALMASDGAEIDAEYYNIKVTDGSAAVVALGADSKVDVKGSKIEVNKGYAAYTDGLTVGAIDLTDVNIVLDGNSTAFDVDLSLPPSPPAPANNPLKLSNTKITVNSDKVIVFNVKNAGILNVSNMAGTIHPAGVIVVDGTAHKYIEAAVDNTTVNIDQAIDKSAPSTSPNPSPDYNSYYYYNRFIAQNSITNVNAAVKAELTSAQAANFKNQVIGLEMNSSKNANSTTGSGVAGTQINNNSTISAARKDSGSGAVGAFINYGQLNNAGTIEVQNGFTSISGATGVYATNGSEVDNQATGIINTYGNSAIGVYATPWRETSPSGLAGDEFTFDKGGSSENVGTQGTTTVTNNGNITTNGASSVGIYIDNNSTDASLDPALQNKTITAANANIITIGANSVGMYAKGDGVAAETVLTNNGTLNVGAGSAGIYGENYYTVGALGNINLADAGAIGLIADEGTDISAITGATTVTDAGTDNKTVVVMKNSGLATPLGAVADTLAASIDTTGTNNVTSVYIENRSGITVSGTNKVGSANGIGVYLNGGDVTNTGTINASGTSSSGMYSNNGTMTNANTIAVNDGTSLGMVIDGAGAAAINNGTISMNVAGATGMFAKSGATVTDGAAGNMTFGAAGTFGIVSDAANVILNGGTKTLRNADSDVYVYANNGSNVTINNTLTIDGFADADPAKSVGIYLDGANNLTNTGAMVAQNAAVGVYVNGANTLAGGTYTADGDKTVGIYMSNGGTLNGLTVNSQAATGNSIGVYVAGGQVTVATGITVNASAGGVNGTGMYFANGASATGDAITVTGGNASDAAVGLYYTGAAATHDTDINMTGSNMVVGLYADAAVTNVTTTKTITDTTTKSVGAMASNGATVTNAGTITTDPAPLAKSVGMYTETGNIVNTGTINVTDGLGAALVNTAGTFNGAGGNITVAGAGAALSLDATVAGQVLDAGTMNITGAGVGVYAKNAAIVDFPMIMTGTSGTGVYAKAGTTVTGTIDGSASSNTIGLFTEDATVNMPSATVKAGSNGIGWYQGGAGQSYATTGNTIEAAQPSSIGVYVDAGNSYASGDTINAGTGGIGVLTYGTFDTNGTTMNIDGSGIGVVAQAGSTVNIGTTGAINVTFTGGGGILSFANGGTINLGSLITTVGSGTISATLNGSLTNAGTISVENGAYGLVGSYDSTAAGYVPSSYTIANTGDITVKSGAVGMAAVLGGGSPATTDVTVSNSGNMTVQDANSVGMYVNVGNISNTGSLAANDNGIGVYATGTAAITGLGTIDVTKGVGYVYDNISAATAPTAVAINLNAGDATTRSIGGYYLNVNNTIDQLTSVTVAGDYAIPLAIEGGTNTVSGNISDAAGFANSIGLFAKNSTTTVNDVTVTGPQDNIGIYSENAVLTTGTVTVGDSNDPAGNKTKASLGIYANKGSVTTTDVTVGKDSIGLFGKEASLSANGNVAVADKGTGAYVDGTGVETVAITGNIATGKNALGAYGKNANVNAIGNIDVSNGLSIGLVGTGTGDINYSGTATVTAKGSESASIAIYKGAGQGTVNTTGTFDVHEGGYAVYADNLKGATGTITVNNGANINLDKTSVGIYAGGNVNSNNTGTITVGESYLAKADHSVSNDDLNSVGLYGEEGAQVSNSGNINVGFDHSVGVYVKTNTSGTGTRTTFTNNARATITADNGGVGVLAVQYSDVINKGTIIVNQTTTPSCGGKSIGVALYSMSTFDNQGEVTINGGYGVFLSDATQYVNNGNMTLNNGAAVVGKGTYLNKGTVTIGGVADTSVQAGKVAAVGAEDPVRNGAIAIDNQGNVVINNQYIGSGAIISDYDIILKNPTIDITGKPSFIANSVSGEISLAPNFINTGNGYSWTVNGFVPKAMNSGLQGKPTINTSPLFMAHMSGQDLLVAKQPYAYLVAGSQFDNLYNGVDSLLALDQEGSSNDSTVLKQLNSYLDNIYNEKGQTEFMSETDRTLAEMRGDIYSTTYKRMENIQTSFDNAFDELLNARNASKDSGKFSVIYQQGEYNDDTLGVDDYDYRVTGLMYMREVESRNYGSKHGFSLGFTVSRFDFDDAPTFHDKSKEDVYSLRAGLHNVHSFGEDGANDRLRLISRLELGYNRHEAVRTIELDKVYKNKGNYNSMNVSLDNKLEATIYRDLKTDVKVYGAINLEYGYMGKFTERAKGDSALELTVKGQHYYSVEPEVGVNASRRAYLGKKVSVKVFGDLAYGYELGNVGKKHRKAKVNGGTEGYYNLIKPAEEKGRAKATVGLTIEKPNGFGVTGEVQFRKHQNKSDNDVRYGVRFNYTF